LIGTAITVATATTVIFEYTLTPTTITIYQNGALVNTFTVTTTMGTETFRNIGVNAALSSNTYFNGSIGEIVVYDSVLATKPRQVVEGYLAWKWGLSGSLPVGHPYLSAPPGPEVLGPLVLLKAVDYSGSGTWNDESGQGRNATLETGVVAKNTSGNGIVLDGSTSWTFPNVEVGNSWSAEVWFKRTGTPTGTGSAIISQIQDEEGSDVNFAFWSDGSMMYNGTWNYGTTVVYPLDTWTNVQISWDGATLLTYMNGSLLGSLQFSGGTLDGGQDYRIGRSGYNPNSYMIGEIGLVRIYEYPVSAAQVYANYTSEISVYGFVPTLLSGCQISYDGPVPVKNFKSLL
jgi:hypothetical protein